jgi:hypothetical protein
MLLLWATSGLSDLWDDMFEEVFVPCLHAAHRKAMVYVPP